MDGVRGIRSADHSCPLQLDLDIDAGGEMELHQRVDRLRRRIDDVEHPLMGADLELLARLLVDMRRAQHGELLDPGRQRDRPAHPRAGPLRGVDDLTGRLVEHAMIVRPQANSDVLIVHLGGYPLRSRCGCYFRILATTPAPTVRPPSRMAQLNPSSMAIGASNSTTIDTLSPGITISVPSGNSTEPVTSVLRKYNAGPGLAKTR